MRSDFKSATQIYVNPIYFELQLILRNDLFLHENRWNRKNCPKFFHRVIYAFWIQICNPNLCKSHIFWSTANIKKWPKLVKSEKIARNSFIWYFLRSEFKSATKIYVNTIHFEIQLILRNDLFSHSRTWWPKSMKSEKLPEILS